MRKKPNKATLIFHRAMTHVIIILCLIFSGLATLEILGSTRVVFIASAIAGWNILRLRVINRLLSKIRD